MFYSSPRLPDWPKQRQISQKRALIPPHLVEPANVEAARCMLENLQENPRQKTEIISIYSHLVFLTETLSSRLFLLGFQWVSGCSIIDGQGSFVSWTFNVSYKALHKTSLEGLWQQLSRCSTDAHWAKESQFSPTNVKKKCIWHTHSQQCWRPFRMVVTLPAGKKRNTMGTNYF